MESKNKRLENNDKKNKSLTEILNNISDVKSQHQQLDTANDEEKGQYQIIVENINDLEEMVRMNVNERREEAKIEAEENPI
jgi:hypothetical protein